jgi:phospholipase/carboxylesterase
MNDLVIHRPAPPPAGTPAPLVLLFHGVGSSAEDLRALGEVLAERLPTACVVSVRSPDRCDLGAGWQWFSVRGITEENRPERIAQAMPRFLETVRQWQSMSMTGARPSSTTLLGFSQGAIMALASTQTPDPPADRIAAIAGRFAADPVVAPPSTTLHLLHGDHDGVVPVHHSVAAAATWQALGGAATLDLIPGLGHGIDSRLVQSLLARLAQPGVTA